MLGLISTVRAHSFLMKAAHRPRFDAWKAAHPVPLISGGPREKREALFAAVAPEGPIAYVEFGVHKGVSLLWWARHNADPASTFDGFDSFEGLPEEWQGARAKGFFDVGGAIPETDDPRVTFHKGWFQETLPGFAIPAGRHVFHFDADLYRSTIYPLMICGPHMRSGDILIFDEFMDSVHEYRAFEDWQAIFGYQYRVIAATKGYCQVALHLT